MLNRARLESKESRDEAKERDSTVPIKLDAPAIAHIEKHRYVLCLFINIRYVIHGFVYGNIHMSCSQLVFVLFVFCIT